MKNSAKEAAPSASSRQNPVEPKFDGLSKLPDNLDALFRAVAISVHAEVMQPDPAGKRAPRRQEYRLPWASFESWKDARKRLAQFEAAAGADVEWWAFNDSESNDGPMSLNAYPGRALIERVTNEGDAALEAKALTHTGPMPGSPADAAKIWYGVDGGTLPDGNEEALAKTTVTVVGFVGDSEDPKDSVFDARDYGIGLTADEMPSTILSLNRGNKKSRTYLTGKHGQGASSTFQYADLTLIASRRIGSPVVAFTFVEARWDENAGVMAKTPTYRYLTIKGAIPTVDVSDEVFPRGTLVRHIGYNASDLFALVGDQSLYGLLMRSLAQPVFPVWLEIFDLRHARAFKYPTLPGYRRYGRVIRGTVTALERAWYASLKAKAEAEAQAADAVAPETADGEENVNDVLDAVEPPDEAEKHMKLLHRKEEVFHLPEWDYGGRSGVGKLGTVVFRYWVAQPRGRTSDTVLKSWVDPDKTILMTLDGQTHAEESRAIVTGKTGAYLWAVGRYMVVQIDCNGLDSRARYELFTSTREHAKETPIKKMILAELVRRLQYDKKLAELNVKLAAADIKKPEIDGQAIADLIKRYLKAAGISFDQLTRKVEKWTDVDAEQPAPAGRPEPPPIEANEPPTFIRWKFLGPTLKLYPGQRHSAVFETDAAPYYWNPGDQTASKIKVLANGVRYAGAGEMKGGRVRCHFECPADAPVGAKGYFIQVQLEYAPTNSINKVLPIEVLSKPEKKAQPKDDGNEGHEKPDKKDDATGEGKEGSKVINVKIRKKDFTEVDIPVVTPTPVNREMSLWSTLGWPADPAKVGFSVRSIGGRVQLYYNQEFPPFLDLKRKMSKRSLEDEFVRRYQVKLVLHAIFTLNYDFVDEDEFPPDQKPRVRNLLCASAESLALATKSELEIEARLKSEDGAPLATTLESTDVPPPIAPPTQEGA